MTIKQIDVTNIEGKSHALLGQYEDNSVSPPASYSLLFDIQDSDEPKAIVINNHTGYRTVHKVLSDDFRKCREFSAPKVCLSRMLDYLMNCEVRTHHELDILSTLFRTHPSFC